MKVIVNILALILACTVTAAVVTGCIDKGDDSSSEAQGADTTASDVKDENEWTWVTQPWPWSN